MSSGGEQRKQNIPQGSYPQEEVVNPQGTARAPSSPQARTGEHTRGGKRYSLMELVVMKHNMTMALQKVETKERPVSTV